MRQLTTFRVLKNIYLRWKTFYNVELLHLQNKMKINVCRDSPAETAFEGKKQFVLFTDHITHYRHSKFSHGL